jgi:hypothetical protein
MVCRDGLALWWWGIRAVPVASSAGRAQSQHVIQVYRICLTSSFA